MLAKMPHELEQNCIGIVLANTGSPAAPTPEEVRTYLQDFLTDPRIRPLPAPLWNFILKSFILPRRSVASAEKYAAFWSADGSPLDTRMSSLTRKMDATCGEEMIVRYAMSYGSPSMQETLMELRRMGCSRIVVIPLYPQSAFSTTEVVRDKLESALLNMEWEPDVRFIDSYATNDLYLDAIAESVRNAGFTSNDRLLLSFHSIPMRDVRKGDTYGQQAHATAEAIAKRLGVENNQWAIGFQSRFDKGRMWLGPFLSEALETLNEGPGRLFVVAPNFSIDCLETLYDIDRVLREKIEVEQDHGFVYVPCLNNSDAHVALIQSIIDVEH